VNGRWKAIVVLSLDRRELIRVVAKPGGLTAIRSQDGNAGRNSGSFRPKGMAKRRPAIWVAFLLVGVLSDERVEYQEKRTCA
jgi:hypothetical protein